MDSTYVKQYISILDKLTAVVPLGEDRGEVGSGTPGQTWNAGGGKLRTRSDNEIAWSNQPGNRGKTYPGDAVAQQQAVSRATDGQNNLDTAKGLWNRFTGNTDKAVDLGKDPSGKNYSDPDDAKLGSPTVQLPTIQSKQLPPMASNTPTLAQTQTNVRNTVAPQTTAVVKANDPVDLGPGYRGYKGPPVDLGPGYRGYKGPPVQLPPPAASNSAVKITTPSAVAPTAAAQTSTTTTPVTTPTASPASDPKAAVAFGKGSAYAAAPDVANDTASAPAYKADVAFGKGNAYAGQPGLAEGDYELEEMRRLTYGKEELDEAPPIPAAGTTPAPTTAQTNTFNAVNAAVGPAVNQMTQAGEKIQAGNKVSGAWDAAKAVNNVANAAGMTFGDKVAGVGSAVKGGYHALKAHVTGNDPGAAFAGSMASDLTQPYADYTNSENFASDFNAGMSNGGGKSANPKLQKAYDNNLVNANSVRNAANSMNKTANQLKSGDASAMQNFEPPSLYRDDQTPYLDINKRNAITQQPVQTKAEIQAANPVQEGDDELEEMRKLAYGTSDAMQEQVSDVEGFEPIQGVDIKSYPAHMRTPADGVSDGDYFEPMQGYDPKHQPDDRIVDPMEEGDDDLATMRRIMNHRR